MTEQEGKRKRVRGRRRMVWQSIWQDEDFRKLSREERLLLIGMITIADDAGRGRASEFTLKAEIFPSDRDMGVTMVKKMRDRIGRLMRNVRIYKVEGELYFQFEKWGDYQVLDHGSPSKFPSPSGEKQGVLIPDEPRQSTALSDQRRANLSQSSLTELNRTETKETEPAKAGGVTDSGFLNDLTDSDIKEFLREAEVSPLKGDAALRKLVAKRGFAKSAEKAELWNFTPIIKEFGAERVAKVLEKRDRAGTVVTNFPAYLKKGCRELQEKGG